MDTVNLSVKRVIFLQVSMYIERLSLLRLKKQYHKRNFETVSCILTRTLNQFSWKCWVMCILPVTVQYQAATGKTQPWRHGSVTVEAQSGPAFGLALAGWDTSMLLYCKFYHLVANQFDTGPPIALGPL